MGAVLAIDVGSKRVGIAIMDPALGLALPIGTFSRTGGVAEKEILKLIGERGVSDVVVGLPLNDDGSLGAFASQVKQFSKRIVRRSGVKCHFIDEYSSSEEAKEILGANVGHRTQGRIDAMAATLILNAYSKKTGV